MLKGIYKAASGMVPRLKMQEITANNIANASTPGFKKDSVFMKELDSATRSRLPRKSDWETPMLDQIYTDYSQGGFDRTDNIYDLALEGDGFFVVQSPQGDTRQYTRNGHFSADPEGFLVTDEGYRVLGDGGPIAVGSGEIEVTESGEVSVDGSAVGNLLVVDFDDKSALVKVGASGFTVDESVQPKPAERYTMRQGFLEHSNINVVKEMVGMIITMRAFEAGSKMIQSQDESLATLFTQVGRTRF
jgi:flagellar basal-body rod protein FlgF